MGSNGIHKGGGVGEGQCGVEVGCVGFIHIILMSASAGLPNNELFLISVDEHFHQKSRRNCGVFSK